MYCCWEVTECDDCYLPPVGLKECLQNRCGWTTYLSAMGIAFLPPQTAKGSQTQNHCVLELLKTVKRNCYLLKKILNIAPFSNKQWLCLSSFEITVTLKYWNELYHTQGSYGSWKTDPESPGILFPLVLEVLEICLAHEIKY